VVADRFVLRTTVTSSGRTTPIGNAFAARPLPDAPPVILTALHRLGPAGGLAQIITPETLGSKIESVTFIGAYSGLPLDGLTARPLAIPTAAKLEHNSGAGDVIAFTPDTNGASQLQPLPLSAELPATGAAVWIAIPRKPQKDGEAATRALRAIVTDTDLTSGTFYYQFPEGSLTLAQANQQTGAPVIDLAGNIVGIHVGAATNSGEETPYGLAHTSGRFMQHLASALELKAKPETMAATKPPEPD